MYGEKELITQKQMNDTKERNVNNNQADIKKLANRIYIFCPLLDKGIMFYNQSPDGTLAKFSGSLPEGKFWSSGERTVEWDETINGSKDNDIPVTDEVSYILNTTKESFKVSNENAETVDSITIMVSESNFYNLLLQLENPTYDTDNHFKILNLNSKIMYLKQNNNYINIFNKSEINNLKSEDEVLNYNSIPTNSFKI